MSVDRRTWAAPPPSGLRRLVPAVGWLPRYDRGDLRFDVVAGATIWGLLVPEVMAAGSEGRAVAAKRGPAQCQLWERAA